MLIGIAVSFVGKACRSSEYVFICGSSNFSPVQFEWKYPSTSIQKRRNSHPQKIEPAMDKLLISFFVLLMQDWHLHSDTEFSFCFALQ